MKSLRLMLLGCLAVALFAVAGCKPSVPRSVISPGDMEDLLYDYHLADAMASQAKGDYAQNVIAYRTAVLKKYDISQAEFDSSMVYYMRHSDQLYKIYEHVSDRMQDKAQELGSQGSFGAPFTANGDTADIWRGTESMVLIPNEPYNLQSFELKADSSFHKGDTFMLQFQSDFIFQDGSRDGIVVLAVVFNNDSVAQRVMHVSSSSSFNVSVVDQDSLGVKSVKGFFMLSRNNDMNSSLTTLKMVCFSNIHLYRMHAQKPTTPNPGSVPPGGPPTPPNGTPVNPAPVDGNNTPHPMSPDSMRH